jgi:hypothetical protein
MTRMVVRGSRRSISMEVATAVAVFAVVGTVVIVWMMRR